MDDVFLPIIIVGMLFIGLPWIILHYVSSWKKGTSLTTEDENLLDELHDLARRLDERMGTIERIIQAENPNWRALAADPVESALEDRSARMEQRSSRILEEAVDRPSRSSNRPSRRTR